MEHPHESTGHALTDAEVRLLELIAAIALQQVITEARRPRADIATDDTEATS